MTARCRRSPVRSHAPRLPAGLLAGLLAAVSVALGAAAPARAQVAPHTSWHHFPLSNGHGASVFDAEAGRFDTFLDHPYARWDADMPSVDLLYDTYFGVAAVDADGDAAPGAWLNTVPVEEVGYDTGRGVLVVRRSHDGLTLRTVAFAPMALAAPSLVAALEVRNDDTVERRVRVFALLNFHVGPVEPGEGTPATGFSDELLSWDAAHGHFLERGATTDHALVYAPLVAPSVHAAAPAASAANPWLRVTESGALDPSDGGATDDDWIAAFQWELVLPPGITARVGWAAAYGPVAQSGAAPLHERLAAWRDGRDADEVLADERAAWDAWAATAALPPAAPDGEPALPTPEAEALYRQSLAMLRMGQVREANGPEGTPHGQILASLPPGMWNISWPRDAAYAIRALAVAGHHAEARDALAFILNGHGQSFRDEAHGDYLVSVCRYFGNGAEESDVNEFGPNIEFDGFGLFLWALGTYLDASGDDAFLAAHWPAVRDEVAGALVRLVDPETGLIRADSSIWEVHWDGQQKRFTYTSVLAVRGLYEAARMADRMDDPNAAATWRATARSVHDAIRRELITPGGLLAANLEEYRAGGGYLDAAVVEAFNLGVIPADDPVAETTVALLREGLAVPSGHGYARNDDGGWYDRQEWIVIDLRIARALRALGRHDEADAIVAWIIAQSAANGRLVAELYERDSADYEGAVPMMGFGAGAYVLDAWERDAPPSLADTCWEAAPPPADGDPVAEPRPDVVSPPADVGPAGDVAAPEDVAAGDVPAPPDAMADAVPPGDTVGDQGAPAPETVAPDAVADTPPPTDTTLDIVPSRDTVPSRSSGGCAAGDAPRGAPSVPLSVLFGVLLLGLVLRMARRRRA